MFVRKRKLILQKSSGGMKKSRLAWDGSLSKKPGRALKRALGNPRAYRLMRRQPQVRRILVHRFPYRIFYVLRDDALMVFAVIHGKRKEATWTDRV